MDARKAPIADRTKENLGASDNGIALYRRVLRREIKKVEEGVDPMFTFRDQTRERAHRPAERAQEAPQQRGRAELDHAHHAAYSPIAEDVIPMYESVKPAPRRCGWWASFAMSETRERFRRRCG